MPAPSECNGSEGRHGDAFANDYVLPLPTAPPSDGCYVHVPTCSAKPFASMPFGYSISSSIYADGRPFSGPYEMAIHST